MWFSRKQVAKVSAAEAGTAAAPAVGVQKAGVHIGAKVTAGQITTKRRGDVAEALALAHLSQAGL